MSQQNLADNPGNLEDFERAVYARDYERATTFLIHALAGFENRSWDLVTVSQTGITKNRKKNSARQLLTRFCSAATALLCDPNWMPSRQGFELILLYKRYLVTIFATTEFVDLRHCLEFIGERKSDARVEYRGEGDLFKVILAATASNGRDLINTLLSALPVDLAFLFWLSLLDNEMVLTTEADQTRNDVLSYAERFQKVIASDASICRVVNTWMFCSYMNNPDKHRVKQVLNTIIKNYCQVKGAKQPYISQQRTIKPKPTVLIICERFTSDHAMFRCYGRAIESLKAHFKIVFFGIDKRIDKGSALLFDDTLVMPQKTGIRDIKTLLGKIISLAPDMIYYPSLGMESWAVGLAQYRLAPIQMMTMGHPATSYCQHMDYLFAEESTLGDAACVNETCLHVRDGTFAMSKGSLLVKTDPVIRRNPDVIKIALPSIAYKLNPDVLAVCNAILEQSTKSVEFHFFPNMSGVNHLAISLRLEDIIPCVVHENKHYNDYMASLNDCDLALSPFPFGNTNGFIDCARLALPVVCLDGPEAHSHTDVALSARFGLPDFCRTHTLPEYTAAALKIINDENLRIEISEHLLQQDIDQMLYANSSETACRDMSDLFMWLYHYHEAIQAEGKHLWTVAERIQFQTDQLGSGGVVHA